MKDHIEQKSLLLKLQDIQYWYPSTGPDDIILNGIKFDVHLGESIRITGRNGSGKTTLLRILQGNLQPTHGRRECIKPDLRVVYLDQNASDFVGKSLTVLEQIVVGLENRFDALHFVRTRTLLKEIELTLKQYDVGLEDKLDAFLVELSGGQRQIVALLSVLLGNPDLLLIDEFTAFMDAKSERTSVDMVQKFIETHGLAVIFVSHSKLEGITCDHCFSL